MELSIAKPSGIPPELEDVTLLDGYTAASVGGMSLSKWYVEVKAGRAPQPAIREPRFVRWTATSVRAYWTERLQRAAAASVNQQHPPR